MSILNFLSSHAGCNNAALMAGLSDPQEKRVVSAQLNRLVVNYGLIDKGQPVFSKEDGRNARYYIADNFLQAWLAVVKPAREAARLKPQSSALAPALRRLETLEGYAFKKLMRSLHVELSRKGKSDFPL